jgi:protein disulfide-isomerase-like protein
VHKSRGCWRPAGSRGNSCVPANLRSRCKSDRFSFVGTFQRMLWCSSPDRLRCIHRHFLWHLLTLSLSIIQGFAVSRALYADQSPVVRLTDDNFRRLVLDSSETWLVEFYAPWCGHCRSLAPNWEKAARRLNGLVRVGAVDCEQNRALAQEYNIQAFPTIKLFTGRKRTTERRQPLDYHGGRSLKVR